MIDSKFGETCCEFGKDILSGKSLERTQDCIPNIGPWFPLQLLLDLNSGPNLFPPLFSER